MIFSPVMWRLTGRASAINRSISRYISSVTPLSSVPTSTVMFPLSAELPPLRHANEVSQRLNGPAQCADGPFVSVYQPCITNHLSLCLFRPVAIPAVNGKRPCEIRQQVHWQVSGDHSVLRSTGMSVMRVPTASAQRMKLLADGGNSELLIAPTFADGE